MLKRQSETVGGDWQAWYLADRKVENKMTEGNHTGA